MKKRTIAIIAIVLVLALVLSVLSCGFRDWNIKCWFGHNYADGVCTRCGAEQPADKPAETTEQSEAFIAEPYQLFASALLAADNDGISTQANASAPTGYRPLKVGDDLDEVVSIAIDMYAFAHSRHSDNLQKMLFNTNNGKIDIFIVGRDDSFGFVDKDFTGGIHWDEDSGDEVAVGYNNYILGDLDHDQITEDTPFYYTTPQNLQYEHLTFGTTVTEVGEVPIYVKLISKLLPPAPTKTGYTFSGWYTDAACTNKYTASTVTSDITLYAGFKANTYSIKFKANSGSGEMATLAMTYDQSKTLTSNAFTKEHFAFKGWATSANGAVIYSNEQSVKNLTSTQGATIELFAQWERSEVKVDFVANGNTTSFWVTIGSNATLPSNPTKEGHNFVGWYYANGTQYTTQNLSEDTTLTARFEIIRCMVTFIVDGELYALYECDWGTSLSDALNANAVNPALMSVEDEYRQNF